MLSRIEVRVQLCPPFLILHSSSDGTAHTAPHHRTQSHPRHSEASSPVMSFDRFSLRLHTTTHVATATLAHPLRHTRTPAPPTARHRPHRTTHDADRSPATMIASLNYLGSGAGGAHICQRLSPCVAEFTRAVVRWTDVPPPPSRCGGGKGGGGACTARNNLQAQKI